MNIAEIAKMAGVSSAAVSRYFNNGYISEEKRAAIQKVVEKTGYRPSLQAQTLRTRKTKMIGLILPRINSRSIGSIVAGILNTLEMSGYQVLMADTQNDPEKELEYLKTFDDKKVDGVILVATIFSPEHKRVLKNMKTPTVLVGQRMAGCNCVYYNDYQAFYDVTKMVLEKGRTHLGYIGVFRQDQAVGVERHRGYCDAVTEAGLEERKKYCTISGFSLRDGFEKAQELMELDPQIDGLICATDMIAIGAMQYLRERNIDVPGRVVVTGQGDADITRVTTPRLTTIHYAYEDSGALAAKRILELIEANESTAIQLMLDHVIVEQESTFTE